MKIFLTGATGFVGSAVLKRLVGAGHTVTGLVQSGLKADLVKKDGGLPLLGDLLVPAPWTDAVKEHDLVISASSPFHFMDALSIHEAERKAEAHAEMVGNLINAARKSRVKAVVLTYHVTALGNHGDSWASEIEQVDPVGLSRPVAGRYSDIDRMARKAGVPTIEVFPGWVYGPGSWFEHYVVAGFKAGTIRIVGAGVNYKSLIHIDDLAEGYRLIAERIPIGERFCLVDSHPVMQQHFLELVAKEMELPAPEGIDYTVFARNAGEVLAEALVSSVRVSNNKAITRLGFKPMYPSYCHGVPQVLKSLGMELKSLKTAETLKASGF